MSTNHLSDNDDVPPAVSAEDILESIVDFGVIATDSNGSITRWNEGAARIFGWTVEEMLGEPLSCLFSADTGAAARLQTEMEKALLAGRSVDEGWHARKNGERFWAFGELMPLKSRSGQPLGYVKVLTDRTNQKLVITQLQQQNENLEKEAALHTAARDLIWSDSPDLLVILGTDGIFQDVNPAWTNLLGWSTSELVGTQFRTLVHPDDVSKSTGALNTAANKKLPNFENRYRHKDGSYRWILWTSSPLGNAIYALGKDVSAEKAQAEVLLRSEDALRQAQKMEAIGQLTGGIAHDFNNMLAGILGNLEMLQLRIGQGNFRSAPRYIDAAVGVANRASALTHRLLAFSRRQTLDPKPTDVKHLVDEMTKLLEQTLGPSIDLEVISSTESLAVLCDTNQLESAVLNLVLNSREAMPHGGHLTIEIANRTVTKNFGDLSWDVEPGNYIEITVRDTGVGMTPDVRRRALDPFFTTKPMGQGTGLGLSMVYGFVKQSKGYLHIDSPAEGGTSVHIFLPPIAEMSNSLKLVSNVLEFPQVPRKVSILLVEDEVSVRRVACEVLTDLGYSVTQAGDAREALTLLEKMTAIDLLVTDVGLPNGMNGRQLADAIREQRPRLPVLFITGYADVALTGGELSVGDVQILTKPFSVGTFASKIRSIVENH